MVAPAWVKVRPSDGLPADVAVSVALNKTWDGTTEITGSISSMLTAFAPGGWTVVSGALQTFLRRAALTYLIRTVGGNGGTEALASGDTWPFMNLTTSATQVNGDNSSGSDVTATLGSGSYAAGNIVAEALTRGASGERLVANNGTVGSTTGTSTPGAADTFVLMASVFGDLVFAGTLTDFNGWNDSDRITAVALAGLTLTSVTTPITAAATSTPPATLKRVISTALTRTSTSLASLKRSTSKPLPSTSTSLASLKRSTSKPLPRTSTPIASLKRSTTRALVATSTAIATLLRAMTRAAAASSTPPATLRRVTSKAAAASSTSIASLFAQAVRLINPAATSTPIATLRRSTSKAPTVASASLASLAKFASLALRLTVTSTPIASLRRATAKALLSISTSPAALRRAVFKGSVAVSAPVATQTHKLSVQVFAQISTFSAATLTKLRTATLNLQASSTSVASLVAALSTRGYRLVRRLTGAQASGLLSGQRNSGKLDGEPL